MWKWSMYYRGSVISHEYLFLNGNTVFKSSEFPHGILLEFFTPHWEKYNALFWISSAKIEILGFVKVN